MCAVDGRELLGRGILSRLAELREPGRMEAFLLYMGKGLEPVVIHRRRVLGPAGGSERYVERFTLGVDGILYYDRFGPGDWEPDLERGGLGVPLRVEGDFGELDYESVADLHGVVMRGAFFDELAYRLDRDGRVGYGDVYRLDPEEELRVSRRLRLR